MGAAQWDHAQGPGINPQYRKKGKKLNILRSITTEEEGENKPRIDSS